MQTSREIRVPFSRNCFVYLELKQLNWKIILLKTKAPALIVSKQLRLVLMFLLHNS